MLDEMTKARIHRIMAKALEKSEEKLDEHSYETAHWLMEMVRDCDHICRKHAWMEKHPEMQ